VEPAVAWEQAEVEAGLGEARAKQRSPKLREAQGYWLKMYHWPPHRVGVFSIGNQAKDHVTIDEAPTIAPRILRLTSVHTAVTPCPAQLYKLWLENYGLERKP